MNRKEVPKEEWSKIKKQCHMDNEEVWMAKRLGLTPEAIRRRLVRSTSEGWKDLVPLRIRRLYSKRFGSCSEKESNRE